MERVGIEYNEYFRVLEHDIKIRAIKVDGSKIGMDTPEDLGGVEQLMSDLIGQ